MLDYFPYDLRKDQKGFIEFVQKNILDKSLCIHAPTGFGKTPLVLASVLPLAKKNNLKIVWVTKTGNETDRPIEELKEIKKMGNDVFGISFRGKRDMCLLTAGVNDLSQEEASYICKTNSDKVCRIKEGLDKFMDKPLIYSEVLNTSRYSCPYKVQRQLLNFVDVVALSYNYILSEGISWAIRKEIDFENSILVVDEAHNIPHVAVSMNSDSMSYNALTRALKEIEMFDDLDAKDVKKSLKKLQSVLKKLSDGLKREDDILDRSIIESIPRLGDNVKPMERFGNKVRKKRLEEGKRPFSSLSRVSRFLSRFFLASGTDGVETIVGKRGIEIFDMRSREILKDVWGNFKSCIFLSGTLSPIKSFSDTVGLSNFKGREFKSNFSIDNVRTFIASDLTTEGMHMGDSMKEKYLMAIDTFLSDKSANTAIFFSSYRIQNELLGGIKDITTSLGRKIFIESPYMKGSEGRRILDGFRSCSDNGNGVLCASMQGRFAEGADFPGKDLERVFIAGVPFDRMNTRTRLLLEYSKNLYGNEKGTLYSYILPAIRRVSQSLGRALRSEDDVADFVLGDYRYQRFLEYLPDYVRETGVIADSQHLSQFLEESKEIGLIRHQQEALA